MTSLSSVQFFASSFTKDVKRNDHKGKFQNDDKKGERQCNIWNLRRNHLRETSIKGFASTAKVWS